MAGISATIITKNEEHNILRCLESVKPVADEIIVVDSLSTDRTAEICRDFGCTVIERAFDGYGNTKQFAVEQACHDWILSIDADEELTPALQQEIIQLFRAGDPRNAGYMIPRAFRFMGREMRFGGVGKEYILRFFDRRKGTFTRVPVHERIEIRGETGRVSGKLIHYSYHDISHRIEKINHYTSLAAEANRQKGRRYSKAWVAVKFPVSFFTTYVLKGGFLDGYPGFIWSLLAALYSSLKIAKTIEKYNRP